MESKSLTNELIDMFDSSPEMPSASAFVQQRSKIKPDAFKTIFESFTSKITTKKSDTLRILAVDGSDVQIATNPGDSTSYHPGSNGQKPYNLLHLNALYDLEHHIYTDAVIQGSGRIHDLFVQVIYGWLLKTALTQKSNTVLFYTECTSSTLEIMYLAHLRKTWKTLHSVSIEEWCKNGHYFLAELELELIYLTSDALLYNQQTSDAKEILEWLCRPFLFACMQKRNKESIRILPLAAVKLAKLEFIEGNIKQAWTILEQTKRLMKREQNNGAIWLILNCQKHFISASRNTQFSVQEKILNEYKKYDLIVSSLAINPYAIWESSTDNHIWISNDVIRNARLQKGLTQHQACEGIIEPETYSRFESGKSRLRWEKQKLLLERLGQSSARVQFIVDSPHPKVLVTAKNILTDIQLGRLNMANEKYIELSCWLTESSVNDKFNQLVTGQLDSMF